MLISKDNQNISKTQVHSYQQNAHGETSRQNSHILFGKLQGFTALHGNCLVAEKRHLTIIFNQVSNNAHLIYVLYNFIIFYICQQYNASRFFLQFCNIEKSVLLLKDNNFSVATNLIVIHVVGQNYSEPRFLIIRERRRE